MASLKCAKCGYGIHYHDEPDGTEWIAFEKTVWEELCRSAKELSSYTVDSSSGWYSIWKCEECGSIHVFKTNSIYLMKAFEPVESESESSIKGIELIAFEDTIWDQITETDETGKDFDNIFKDVPRRYVRATEDEICVFSDPGYKTLEARYKSI